jgi:hypothetical protein
MRILDDGSVLAKNGSRLGSAFMDMLRDELSRTSAHLASASQSLLLLRRVADAGSDDVKKESLFSKLEMSSFAVSVLVR